jgi:hypothetical protein
MGVEPLRKKVKPNRWLESNLTVDGGHFHRWKFTRIFSNRIPYFGDKPFYYLHGMTLEWLFYLPILHRTVFLSVQQKSGLKYWATAKIWRWVKTALFMGRVFFMLGSELPRFRTPKAGACGPGPNPVPGIMKRACLLLIIHFQLYFSTRLPSNWWYMFHMPQNHIFRSGLWRFQQKNVRLAGVHHWTYM